MKYLLSLLLLLPLEHAFSSAYKISQSECSNVDIRENQPPAVKKHLSTPADQGYIGWCYGYAASDLLTVEAGAPLSATHVSSVFNKSIRSNFLWKIGYDIKTLFTGRDAYEGGFIGKAADEAMSDSPICLHNDIDKYTHLIGMLEVAKSNYKEKKITEGEMCEIVQRSLPNINVQAEDFMEKFITKNINDTLEGMLRNNCKEVAIPKKETKVIYKPFFWGKDKYAKKVNDLLNAGKPLGVSYNASHIADMSGYHASTVIGRRWKNGKCEYNIRNTWGRMCNYKPSIECNQDDGSYWVKDEDFYKLSLNFTYLE